MSEYNIEQFSPQSGRILKEDNTYINKGDAITTDGSGNPALRITLAGGTGTLTDLTITGNLTVEGNFNFGDVGADVMVIAGYIQGSPGGNTNVQIGSSAPDKLTPAINNLFVGGQLEVDGTSFFDALLTAVSADIADLTAGLLQLPDDGGLVDLADIAVTATPASGTPEGYIFSVDSNPVLTVRALADSAGSITEEAIIVEGAVFMKEITTPTAIASYGSIYTKADNLIYFQDGGGTEHEITISDVNYGEMKIAENTTATEIREDAEWQALTANVVTGLVNNFTYDAGLLGVVASIADAGGGDITVTDVAHGLSAGNIITMNGHTDAAYNGIFEVKTVPTLDTFTITAVYTATDTGYWQKGASLTVGSGGAGIYKGTWSSTGIAATNGHVFDFGPVVNTTVDTGAIARRTFSNADYGSFSGTGLVTLAEGDVISFVARNNSASGNITIRAFDLNLHRI
jgi:hypothetical protein